MSSYHLSDAIAELTKSNCDLCCYLVNQPSHWKPLVFPLLDEEGFLQPLRSSHIPQLANWFRPCFGHWGWNDG